ncbi:MAG TPA: antibiotic biosynthesis monooxygenase, partial [Ktedonobacteraceae bacterium]
MFTYIIPFEVPKGQEDMFHQQWHDMTEPLSHAPGFLSARLYEINPEIEAYVQQHIFHLKWLEQRFRFTSIAEWTSIGHFEAAMRFSRMET